MDASRVSQAMRLHQTAQRANACCPRRFRGNSKRAAAAVASQAVSATISPVLARQPSVGDVVSAMKELGMDFFAPPVVNNGSEQQHIHTTPFLTKQAGALPVKPRCLDHALYMYGSYTSQYVSVRVENVHIKLQSWDHAVQALGGAEAARQPYWCSLLEDVQHPPWWPATGHVPQYDQVIFGRGNASIGLHFDKDNACAGGSRRPVSTYLAICEGAKLTLLLPPDQTLLPAGGDPQLLLKPTRQLLEDVKAAGGYFFLLQDLDEDQGGWPAAAAAAAHPGNGDNSATALYMPSGWYHWLVGLTDWHVVYGGSFYPEQQQQQ